jgi:hypothetical protein
LQRVVTRMGFRDTYLHSKPALLELCQTLGRNEVSERYHPRFRGPPTLTRIERRIWNLLSLPLDLSDFESVEYDRISQDVSFLGVIIESCQGRCLFRSVDGRLGLAPKTARAGDIVAVVLGLGTPLVLRPINDNKFQVVGEAYYSGIMEGEALLGPQPDGIEIFHWDSPATGALFPAYFDRNENTVASLDPRLGDMPPDWKIEIDLEDVLHRWFVNEETGEKTDKDPRVTLELLKNRGVELQVFDLI